LQTFTRNLLRYPNVGALAAVGSLPWPGAKRLWRSVAASWSAGLII